MSLRARVLAGVALIAVLLGVAALVLVRSTESNLIDQVDGQLASADVGGRGFDFGGGPGPRGGGPHELSSLYVGYISSDGRPEAFFTPNLASESVPLPKIRVDQAIAAAETGKPFTVGALTSGLRYRVLAAHDNHDGGTIVVALPLDTVDNAVSRLVTVELAATAAILAVLAIVAWWVLHLGVRPIKRMTETASAIAAGGLSNRVPAANPRTEAGELGLALNNMLGRIEEAFDERSRSEDRLRQFVADASHELRTPVTTIRGYAELFRTGGLEDREDLGEAMRRTEQEAVRMGSLVEDLLHLARLDQGRPMEREPVDLAAVANDAARDACAVDPERSITTRTNGPLIVTGDEGWLRQVVANVVANALVHTPPGTPIVLQVGRTADRAVVEIVDEGPGMPPEVAARAFERFYRADPSRSRHRGGSGLGLSIVQATVRAHGGDVELRSAPGEGTTVRIELPI